MTSRICTYFILCFLLLKTSKGFAQQGKEKSQQSIDREKSQQSSDDGNSYLRGFRPVEALQRFDSAIVYAKRANDKFLEASALLGAGQARWYKSNFRGGIDTVNKAIAVFRTLNTRNGNIRYQLVTSLRIISNIYHAVADYENAFNAASESLELNSEDQQNRTLSLIQMGALYKSMYDYATALVYFHQAEDLDPRPLGYGYRELNTQMGLLYSERNLFDSALYHYRRALPGHPLPTNVNLRIGECYILQGKFDTAYEYLIKVYHEEKIINDLPILIPAMMGMAKIYIYRNQIDSSLLLAREAYEIANRGGVRQDKRDASLLLANIYEKNNNGDLALSFYKQYVALKDSILSDQFKGQLYAFKKRSENAAHESEVHFLRTILLVIVLVAVFVFLVLMLRHKNEKLRLKQRSTNLEMQALRAQMNPHFIFNCLTAINHFILNKDTDSASDYLTRFSRLIRLVLINAEKATVTLEEELTLTKLYLEMEQLRFVNSFDFDIRYDATIQPSMVTVPSFILQPFCENAIWHGLLHKEGKGKLIIDLAMEGKVMVCTITDNGIGLTKAAAMKANSTEKQNSLGLKLTTDRLAIFNGQKGRSGSFVIEDVPDASGNAGGTRVIIKIKNNAHD
jgi:tetratricopeptide (TPR) repeat protein